MLTTLAAALLACADLGCATCKTPPPFHLTLEADKFLNPDVEGASFATRVLVLQLKDLEAMSAADFNEVRKDPASVLGESLVGEPTELAVKPGEAESRWIARHKDARYVATLAIFQLPTKHWWASHRLGSVSALQCRDVSPEAFNNRRPWSSEEQMRFYLKGSDITLEQPAEGHADRAAPPHPERGS